MISRSVTKKDVENVLLAITQAYEEEEIDDNHYLNHRAIVLFGAFTGQRPQATHHKRHRVPASPSASGVSATPSPTLSPTPTPTLQPSGSVPTQATVSGPASVAQGQAMTFTTTLYSVNEHKNVCGAVNYCIDDQAAGGTWNINPAGTYSASSGSLSLTGTDTAKLSVGTHTLKIDWLGDSTYGPSQASEQFRVTPSSTPTTTPLIQLVGDSATHVYHLPSSLGAPDFSSSPCLFQLSR